MSDYDYDSLPTVGEDEEPFWSSSSGTQSTDYTEPLAAYGEEHPNEQDHGGDLLQGFGYDAIQDLVGVDIFDFGCGPSPDFESSSVHEPPWDPLIHQFDPFRAIRSSAAESE